MQLPADVSAGNAEATLENGVLRVTLSKDQTNPLQRIAVKAKEAIPGED